MAKNHEASDEAALVKLVQLVHVGHCGRTLRTSLVEATWDRLYCVFASIVDLSPIEPLDKVGVCHRFQLLSFLLAHAFEAILQLLLVLVREEMLLGLP